MTPHINAKKEDIAKTVLMPGDPLRAKYIAETFLDPGFKKVNSIRNMFMFTGTYKGKPVTIAGSGMGCPSIGIYSYELFKFYDVDRIIRVGSTGAYTKEAKLFETVLVKDAYADSSTFRKLVLGKDEKVALPSSKLNQSIEKASKEHNINIKIARTHSSDAFYSIVPLEQRIKESDAYCVEMESFALFTNAEVLNKEAACLLTVSDNLVTHEETTPEQREKAFNDMIKLALTQVK
ncbi:purine-nucleoside phosphorylase [Mycoplasma sp. Mirounga ES2805-ORL]|uniref:purine-nucleoside phosphorylase n=1 Tax=Mycoplasma sp. Mirounga ES2805-ORL TaxID=754514 RepID=UPI00197B350B|nr:purine-nucleoside phosphorylase [Mycoplasma sp. Mirounga ES2805-ORL]QSF13828.1 purine-nucleoside phosphorylase [Mycoplasma sp. Mirounga ES2805-ORL]